MSKKDLKNVPSNAPFQLDDFDYSLPSELIATTPCRVRSDSRLLVASKSNHSLEDRRFHQIQDYLEPGDVLVMNDSKVFPARIKAKKDSGGKLEILLVKSLVNDSQWHALLRPKLKRGQEAVLLLDSSIRMKYQGQSDDGYCEVYFSREMTEGVLEKVGEMPLPPYIHRQPNEDDAETYQTVYAKNRGSIAAPTAGLHFTEKILEGLSKKGIQCAWITLHVGYGTFQPVRNLDGHQMHVEEFELNQEVANRVNSALDRGHRVWAVGTTSVRVLETCAVKGRLVSGRGTTNLFIKPPFHFEIVQGMITNFHLPKSTLLMLVSAFGGHDFMKEAYQYAIDKKYRFYSYGDAMLIA